MRAIVVVLCMIAGPGVYAECASPCVQGSDPRFTDKYFFEVDSASGAVGDVVGVTLSLRSQLVPEGMVGALLVFLAHDANMAEIVGSPLFTDEFLSLIGPSYVRFVREDYDACLPEGVLGHGFYLFAGIHGYEARFPSDIPLPIATLYYRLKGSPGDVGFLAFSENLFGLGCSYSILDIRRTTGGYLDYTSTSNVDGRLTILDGPATHPDRPPEPPEAKIYPVAPTTDQVNLRVRITGARARPGDRNIPIEIYAAADVEYTSIFLPVDFDERYLRLAKVEKHFLTGMSVMDNFDETPGSNAEEGNAVVFSGMGVAYRRLAAEGEEIHAATLYFDVLEGAAGVTETRLDIKPVSGRNYAPGFNNTGPWIIVYSTDGGDVSKPPIQSQVEPVSIINGLMLLEPSSLVLPGDSNLDGQLDISDAVGLLAFLFQGGPPPVCPGASDFNRDGQLDITDPIAMLNALFLGAPMPDGEIPCR